MKLTEQLKASIKEDIVICESYPQRNGSEALYGQMVAKYSMLDEGFAKNLSTNGKITSLDREYDYRPELKAIAAKLHMRLMLDNSDTAKEEKDRVMPATVTSPQVFISHRSTDKAIAEMLVDFLIGTGIPITYIFCSSLPGNDVKEKIPQEVKDAIKKSVVNIAILSHEYYRSAYCLNEAGIFWFLSAITTIPIALPEISSNSMYGFLDDDYKIRRLDNENDISYIYDTVRQATAISQEKSEYITTQISKLKSRYLEIIKNRPAIKPQKAESVVESITTDDEAVILY
ncbi:MAG TPA: toll/interleukin-1 receptor domain-containing protein, partial [Candidatus Acidoferrum sp.]|nr:toll/interleukin-1 receptor domain-containing protein [Candidatus Acidoferrum sp.]